MLGPESTVTVSTFAVGAGDPLANSRHCRRCSRPATPRARAKGSTPLQASIIDKYVGVRYGDSEDTYRFNAYSTADAAVNYMFDSFMALKNAKVGVTLQNITDRHDIYLLNGYTSGATPAGYVNGNPLFLRLPGRSVQLNLSASF